ncbi:MAG: PIN domain-containing protein [Pseudonocardiaceae bacterium]
MSGATLDTGALIALESGDPFLRALVRRAVENRVSLAIPAGVLAQAWRGSARQVRLAHLLRASITEVVALDRHAALAVGKLCALSGKFDVIDVSVVICARQRGHSIVTSDPDDLRAIDPDLPLVPVT